MKIVIIGAGISGVLAANYFKTDQIFDQAKTPVNQHKAVMRIRDPRVGMLLGCDMNKIIVKKGVYFKERLLQKTNILINNLYSIKVSGGIDNKSVFDLSDSERYLLSSFDISSINYNHNLIAAEKNKLVFSVDNKVKEIEYDFCISTIPIWSLLKACSIDPEISFEYNPIFVTRFKISISSFVHQTVYFPEPEYLTYRSTLEGQDLIIEAIDGYPSEEEISFVASVFGLSFSNIKDRSDHKQIIGKIVPIDDSVRKYLIHEITEKFNIYSLGRFAIWKQIRTDDVIKDLEVIRKLISVGDKRRSYESKLNQLY